MHEIQCDKSKFSSNSLNITSAGHSDIYFLNNYIVQFSPLRHRHELELA
jgi:hypothetical protein